MALPDTVNQNEVAATDPGRPNHAAMAIVPTLGERLTLKIDPCWPQRLLWLDKLPNFFGDRLSFTFVDLETGITENANVNYADQDVIGRAESYKTFVGQSNRELTIAFKFRVQGVLTSNVRGAIQQEVIEPARWLDSLQHPLFDRATGLSHAPPPLYLQIGRDPALFSGRVIITAAPITWVAPFDPVTLQPHGADVNCTFQVVRRQIENYSFDGVFE